MHSHLSASDIRSRTLVAAALVALALAAAAPRSLAQVSLPTDFRDTVLVASLNLPTSLAFLPGGRLLFVEQTSKKIRLLVDGALSSTDPVGTVDSVNTSGAERGLLGIAVDPGWPVRPYVYIHCDNSAGNTIRITRYELQGDLDGTGSGALTMVAGSKRNILTGLPDAADNHNGGTVRFGLDGMLYASIGEDAAPCLAQDVTSWHGVILRLDVRNVPAGGGAAPALATITPADNPFVGNASPAARLVYAFGLRNPFRFHIDPADGSLFVTDVGETTWEEVDHLVSGGHDMGWPGYEGFDIYDDTCAEAITPTPPIHVYDHSEGRAIVSAGVYPPVPIPLMSTSFPGDYTGDYFFSDYYSGSLWRLRRSGSTWNLAPAAPGQADPNIWGKGFQSISDWMIGPDASLWYCRQYTSGGSSGQIGRIMHDAGSNPPPPPTPAPEVSLGRPRPQPSNGVATIDYGHSTDGNVSLRIYDLRGSLVRVVMSGRFETAGVRSAIWDGLDDEGGKAPSGVYVARFEGPGGERAQRVVMVR